MRACAGQREFQTDDLTFVDGSHALESQPTFAEVEENTSIVRTEIGVIELFAAAPRMRPAVFLLQPFIEGDWRKDHGPSLTIGLARGHRG